MKFSFSSLKRYTLRTTLVLSVCALTASCSWLQNLETDPTADWSADKLYEQARDNLNEGLWEESRKYYTKLEARYPFSTYAQQAQIELIYVNWKDGESAAAIDGADRFLKAYPNHAHSDYVMYMKSKATLNHTESWFTSLTDGMALKDPAASREAFDILKELTIRYPQSRFVPEARRLMHELVLAQAQHELITAQYYFERYAYVAAIDRAKRILVDFQTTPQRDAALDLIVKSYEALNLKDLADDYRRIIELNKTK